MESEIDRDFQLIGGRADGLLISVRDWPRAGSAGHFAGEAEFEGGRYRVARDGHSAFAEALDVHRYLGIVDEGASG